MLKGVRANLIWVADVRQAKEWYERVLGFETLEHYPEEGFIRMRLGKSEFFIEHHNPKIHRAFHGMPGGRSSALLEVDNVRTAVHELERRGTRVVQPAIQQFYGGWNAIISDPDGNEFVLTEGAEP